MIRHSLTIHLREAHCSCGWTRRGKYPGAFFDWRVHVLAEQTKRKEKE